MVTRRELLERLGAAALGAGLAPLRRPSPPAPRQTPAPDVELELTAGLATSQILPGPATEVWRYSGRVVRGPAESLSQVRDSYLGPTLRLRQGQRVRIRFQNRLPDPSIVHWHGLDVPEEADGHPRLAVPGGREYVYDFQVTNRAGTYWYHPHPHMQTGPQVYRGLAGLLIVSDDEERKVGLPEGAQELTCVLQDRRFDAKNQFVYSTAMMDMETGMLGDRVLVNGRLRPEWSLGTRAYRMRVLNGSNARVYKLEWSDGTPMTILGTDGGLLSGPVTRKFVTLAPGQRLDLFLDLSKRPVGQTIELRSGAFPTADAGLDMGRAMGGMGRGMGMGMVGGGGGAAALGSPFSLLSLRVARREEGSSRLPERLSVLGPAWQPAPAAPVRRVPLTFQQMAWFIDGRAFEMADVAPAETVAAGSTAQWEFVNAGGPMGMQMAHPIHMHGRQFRVVSRSGAGPSNALRDGLVDDGWMDTVLVLPGETVRVQVTFSRFQGFFLYHCHILEHEDMGMMRNFRIA
jgi:FtsP/CotA-like multicopper oxidase with cupredoxin domain